MGQQKLYTAELINYLQSLMWTNLQDDLSLKACQIGDISYYNEPEPLSALVPAIFIRPSGGVQVGIRTMNFKYTMTYRFRAVYVFKYLESDPVVENKMSKINLIADLIFDNPQLVGISTTPNIKIVHCIPHTIEYEPPEDGFLVGLGGQMTAGAINIEILTGTNIA